jgi:hypothetical protein
MLNGMIVFVRTVGLNNAFLTMALPPLALGFR